VVTAQGQTAPVAQGESVTGTTTVVTAVAVRVATVVVEQATPFSSRASAAPPASPTGTATASR
jgi:hypothetical protein